MADPTFKPGDTVWHVRHGKVTLKGHPEGPAHIYIPSRTNAISTYFTPDGKEHPSDVGRVLYTLDEARQYGWLKEPRVVEFETTVAHYGLDYGTVDHPLLQQFGRKRVRVRVEEVVE